MNQKTARRIFTSILIIIFEFTSIAAPLTYAQNSALPSVDNPIDPAKLKTVIAASKLDFISTPASASDFPLSLRSNAQANPSAVKAASRGIKNIGKRNFSSSEKATLTLTNPGNETLTARVTDSGGKSIQVESIGENQDGVTTITIKSPRKFKPGKFTALITTASGQQITQDFTWGVLAINTDKSVYSRGDSVKISIAVLNETGNMACDASVQLYIRNSTYRINELLSTENGKIIVNKECTSHSFTLNPDYEARVIAEGPGIYDLSLSAKTKNGTYTISDSFEVRNYVPFDVTRTTATRIYPPLNYPVLLDIAANEDFEGQITETVPGSFYIENLSDESVIAPLNAKESVPIEHVLSASTTADPSAEPDSPNLPGVSDTKEPVSTASADLTPTPAPDQESNQQTPIDDSSVPDTATTDSSTESATTDVETLPEVDTSKIMLGDLVPGLIPGLSLPFSGSLPVSLWFSQHLIDKYQRDLYRTFGLIGHDGIDFAMPIGTPILAAGDGEVIHSDRGDYGITVVIQHSWGRSYYGHLSETIAKKGDKVVKGTRIALSGNTGITTGPHLHFGIKPASFSQANGYYGKIDPSSYLGLVPQTQVIAQGPSEVQVLGASTTAPAATPETRKLTWNVSLKKGDKITIGYSYLAPRISPQFYTLGPAVFTNTEDTEVFRETRTWSIAADAMNLKFKKGSFTKSTCTVSEGGCNQVVTGVGFQPKALIFFWTIQTSEAFAGNYNIGMGIATESANFQVSAWSQDAVATSNAGTSKSPTDSIRLADIGNTVLAEAAIESMDSDGFTLIWTTNNASAYIIHYIALGGTDITDAAAGRFTIATSGTPQTILGPDFRPDFLFLITGHWADATTGSSHFSMGFTNGAKQANIFAHSQHNVGTTNTWRMQRQDALISDINDGGGAIEMLASFNSFTNTGFRLNVNSFPITDPHAVYYLALKGGSYDIGSFAQRTSAGTQQVTTGFQPSGVMLASVNNLANSGLQTNRRLSIGGGSIAPGPVITDGSIWSGDNDGLAGNSEANMNTDLDKIIRMADISTAAAEADLNAFDATSFTLNWTTATNSAREIIYWAAGDSGATQQNYRWYNNRDNITPTTAMQDEDTPAIMSQNSPYVRLRTNIEMSSVASLAAQTQKFKLQYATATSPSTWIDVADPWCNDTIGTPQTCTSSWTKRKKITFDNSASNENLTNFPVMIKLSTAITGWSWADTLDAGQDIRFVDPSDPNTILTHDIERWDEGSNQAIVWVKVPQVDAYSNSDYIWMYYGNGSIADGQQSTSVWSNGYSAVWAFNSTDYSAGSGTTSTDETGNSRTATVVTTPLWDTGQIGYGIRVNGSTANGWHADDNAAFDGSNKLTIKTWVKADTAFVNWSRMIHKEAYGTPSTGSWYLQQGDPTAGAPVNYLNAAINRGPATGATDFKSTQARPEFTMSVGTWYHVVATYDGKYLKLYLNGIETHNWSNDYPGTTIPDSAHCVTIGYAAASTAGCETTMTGQYDGWFDQVYLSDTVARSHDWIVAEYKSESDTFCTYGSAETAGAYDWTFYDNTTLTNGQQISTSVLSGAASGSQESYQESNPTYFNPAVINLSTKREWDFSLDGSNATYHETYYFRLVTEEDDTLAYANVPTLTIGPPLISLMRHGKWFGYQRMEPFTF